MKTRTRVVTGVSIVLAPLLFGIGDQLRMVIEPTDGEFNVASIVADFERINSSGLWTVVSYTFLLAMLVSIPALLGIWKLTVDRAPRWAWAGAILAVLGVIGETVHLAAYFGLKGALAGHEDPLVAAEIFFNMDGHTFMLVLFIPYLVGLMFASIVQAIGLRRARVIPLWAALAVAAGVATAVVAGGSTPVATAIWAVLLIVGFAPAALAMLRYETEPEYALPPAPARVTV